MSDIAHLADRFKVTKGKKFKLADCDPDVADCAYSRCVLSSNSANVLFKLLIVSAFMIKRFY